MVRRVIAVGLVSLGLLTLAPAIAYAEGSTASGSVGFATAFPEGRSVTFAKLRPCGASTNGSEASNVVWYGSRTNTCTKSLPETGFPAIIPLVAGGALLLLLGGGLLFSLGRIRARRR